MTYGISGNMRKATVFMLIGFMLIGSAMFVGCSHSGDWVSQLKNAQQGDWAKYNVTIISTVTVLGNQQKGTGNGTSLVEVVSNDSEKIKLRTTTTTEGQESVEEKTIDLSKTEEEMFRSLFEEGFQKSVPGDVKMGNLSIELGKKSNETVTIADKKYNCTVMPITMSGTITANGSEAGKFIATGKEWRSTTVSAGGIVKTEMVVEIKMMEITMTMNMTQTLDSFGKGGR